MVPIRCWIRESRERATYPMRSKKSIQARYYWLKCGYASTATYHKRFGLKENDQC